MLCKWQSYESSGQKNKTPIKPRHEDVCLNSNNTWQLCSPCFTEIELGHPYLLLNTGLQTLRGIFLSIIPCHFAQMCHHQNPKYWEMDFVPRSGPTSDLWAKRNRKFDSNNSEKLPAEPYLISTAHQKAVKMEIASVCRQWCCNIHPGLTWMSRVRGWEHKPMWIWFSLWLETIHPQDTFLSLHEGWEKWRTR